MLPFPSLRLRLLERMLLRMRTASIRRTRVPHLPQHLEMGERGELAALFALRRLGYVIVARRWKNVKQRGDLDLVAWEGNTLCFIEVKTRRADTTVSAESAVDEEKRQILRRLARVYVKAVEPPPETCRFDVISLYGSDEDKGKFDWTLFRSAFDW